MKEIKVSGIWDWKEPPYDELKKILKKFGIDMYELPCFEGSDMYGFLFSNTKLSKKEIGDFEKTLIDE